MVYMADTVDVKKEDSTEAKNEAEEQSDEDMEHK